MISILNHETPDDFVLATGHSRRLKEFVETAFRLVGITNWEDFVTLDKSLNRPADVFSVVGDFSKAKEILNWSPTVNFEEIVKQMLEYDLELLEPDTDSKMWQGF
jgi:GDPmannose 4,6-dehydratase